MTPAPTTQLDPARKYFAYSTDHPDPAQAFAQRFGYEAEQVVTVAHVVLCGPVKEGQHD